tara:strand:+ start:526 stop:1035 length:510 start_codon:yes stop_codon:yes gene_type:complete
MKPKIKFKLRRPKKSDLDCYYENRNNIELDRGLFSFTYPYNKKKAVEDLDKLIRNNEKANFDVFFIDINGECAGEVGITEIFPKSKGKIHYWLGKKYRGKGIMTRAVKLIVKYGFKKYKLRRIWGKARKHNKASQKVMEKAGFKLEGVLRKNVLKRGKYYDDFMFARVR